MGLSRAFLQKRSGTSYTPTSSHPGVLTCGFPQRCLRISGRPRRCNCWLSCVPARLRAGARVLCLDKKTNREPTASFSSNTPLARQGCRHVWSRSTSALVPCTCSPLLIRGRGRSRLSPRDANARQHSSPCETFARSGDSCRGEAHLSRAREHQHPAGQTSSSLVRDSSPLHLPLLGSRITASDEKDSSSGSASCKESACAEAPSLIWIIWHSGSWPLSWNGMRKHTRSTGRASPQPGLWRR